MEKIELHTAPLFAGAYTLVIALDAEQDFLLYQLVRRPDVILWGSRVFVRETDSRYVEGFAYTARTSPGREPKRPEKEEA